MSYTSPWLSPEKYIGTVNSLSSGGITIDNGVARTVREAQDFASKYSGDFSLVTQLKVSTAQFNENWTKALHSSRDAASSVSGWLRRFDEVFLSMINDVESEGDARDLVTEFNSFLQAGHPSLKFQLDATPGPKRAFEEIESLADKESQNVIASLQGSDWRNGLKKLKENLPAVVRGVQQVRGALNSYATKLD